MKAVLLAVSQTPIPPPTVDGSQAPVADARIDPFSATESEIKSLRPDITVRFHEKTRSLRVIVDVRDSRRRSKLLKLIEATPGALFLRSERAYYVLTQSLGDLLRQLRTAKATFAVERTLGDQLKATAARRAALIAQPTTASAADIQECLLFPSVVRRTEEEHGEWYRLEGYTATHLKIAFPDLESYGQRRERAESLTIAEVADVRYRLQSVGVTLWLPSSMEERLAENASRLRRKLEDGKLTLEESTLDALSPDAAWVVAPDGRAGIVVDSQSLIDFYQRAIQQKKRGCLVPAFGKRVFHPAVDSELPSAVEYVERQLERTIPRSKAFAERLTECHRRSVLRGRCMELQQQVDAKLAAPRTELEESLRRLFPHQRVAVEFLLERERALLGDDMGLGKTLSVLTTFAMLREKDDSDFLFVVCPNSLVRNWEREVGQWFPELSLALLPDEKKARISSLKKMNWGARLVDGLVMNYEAVRLEYLTPLLEELLSRRRVLLCVDESQRAKNHASKTFQALRILAAHCPRRVLLSGTPAPKDASDIWAQMLLLDEGERFGTNFYQWLEKIAVLGNRYSDYAIKSFREEVVAEEITRVQEILLRRRKEDVINLPEKTFTTRDITLSGDQRRRYDEIRQELLLRIESTTGEVYFKEITSILEEYLRAVQMASNPRLIDPGFAGDPAKFVELDEIVNEVVGERGEKIVIWTNFLLNVSELVERYKKYGAAPFSGEVPTDVRAKTVDQFQNGPTPRVLVALPAAGGVGITLTAAQTAVYIDKTWNGEHWMQSVDRLHRIGQRGTVNVITLQAGKVDWLIGRNLQRKTELQSQLLGDGSGRFELEAPPSSGAAVPTREELLAALRGDP